MTDVRSQDFLVWLDDLGRVAVPPAGPVRYGRLPAAFIPLQQSQENP